MSYTITHHPHGIAVTGPIPLGDLDAISGLGGAHGYDRMDAGIAQAIGATFVVTSAAGSAAWRAEIAAKKVTA